MNLTKIQISFICKYFLLFFAINNLILEILRIEGYLDDMLFKPPITIFFYKLSSLIFGISGVILIIVGIAGLLQAGLKSQRKNFNLYSALFWCLTSIALGITWSIYLLSNLEV